MCFFLFILELYLVNMPAENNIFKDKNGFTYTHPERRCKDCTKYPCIRNMDRLLSDFAKYGCVKYESANIFSGN